MTNGAGPEAPQASKCDWRVVLPLGVILFLGFALRVYRLHEQSLWWDDYNGLAHLTLEGFFASMAEARRVNPEGAPLYHVVQYAAAQVFGAGEYTQRLLNAGIGVITIPLVFVAGRNSFGTRAGLLAALLFAVSPPHIYYAQSLRFYPLAMLFATIALLTMERMLTQHRPQWLFLNALANGALCMTHLFGLFAVLAQGTAALILLGARHRTLLIAWSAVQFVCLLPAAYWVSTMAPRTESDFWHFSFPTFTAIVKDLFGDDLTDFAVNRATLHAEVFGIPLETPWIATCMAFAMMGVFMLVVIAAIAQGCLQLRGSGLRGGMQDPSPHFARLLLMLCFWALPVVYLVGLAFFWWPVVYPRYTLYACLGLYVLAGAMVQTVPKAHGRTGMVAAFAALYAFQLLLMLPADTRTQWRQAAQIIAAQASPNDMVLVGGTKWDQWPEINQRTLCYHLTESAPFPVTSAHSSLDLVEQLRSHFLAQAGAHPPSRAWYVYNSHYDGSLDAVAQGEFTPLQYLESNGIAYEVQILSAEEGLLLVRIDPWESLGPDTPIIRPYSSAADAPLAGTHAANMMMLGLDSHDPSLLYLFERAIEEGLHDDDDLMLALFYFPRFCKMGACDTARRLLDQYMANSSRGFELALIDWYVSLLGGDLEAALETAMAMPAAEYASIFLVVTLWVSGEESAARTYYSEYRALIPEPFAAMRALLDIAMQDGGLTRERALAYRSALLPHDYRLDSALFLASGLEDWVSASMPSWQPVPASRSTIESAKAFLAAGLE